jgi:hypothetical protein
VLYMSGHKHATVSISQEEYRRLHEAEMKLRFRQDNMPETVEKISRQTNAKMAEYHHVLEARQQGFLDTINDFNNDLANLELRTSQALLTQQNDVWQKLQQVSGTLWNHTEEILAEYEQRYCSQVRELQQTNHDELLRFEQQFLKISQSQKKKIRLARTWLSAAYSILDFIERNYEHNYFLPGQVTNLTQKLEQARQNLELGIPEASCLAAQQVYTQLSQIRLELEKMQVQRQLVYQTAWEYTQYLKKKASESCQRSARGLDWEELPYEIEVDSWINGDLHRLDQKIEELLVRLEEDKPKLTLTELNEISDSILPDIDRQLDELVYRARVNVLNSQLRINIADLAIQALTGQGYVLQDACYQSNNMSAGYYARLKNLEGSEIYIQVEPIAEAIGQNELHLVSSEPTQKTAHEIRQNAAEISSALDKVGLKVGEMQVRQNGKGLWAKSVGRKTGQKRKIKLEG